MFLNVFKYSGERLLQGSNMHLASVGLQWARWRIFVLTESFRGHEPRWVLFDTVLQADVGSIVHLFMTWRIMLELKLPASKTVCYFAWT